MVELLFGSKLELCIHNVRNIYLDLRRKQEQFPQQTAEVLSYY